MFSIFAVIDVKLVIVPEFPVNPPIPILQISLPCTLKINAPASVAEKKKPPLLHDPISVAEPAELLLNDRQEIVAF